MAEETKGQQNQRERQQATADANTDERQSAKSEKMLKVELLALSWQQLDDKGTTVKRHRRGSQIELPESVVNSVNSNGFKPAFRVLGDNE